MSTLELRQIGNAVVLILPKALLEQLNTKPGDSLKYSFEDGKLIIESRKKSKKLSKYDLDKLLGDHKQILPFLESEYESWDIQKPKETKML